MPKVDCDWYDMILDAGEPTTGWACEMHIRTAAGATPAIKKFTTAAGQIVVGLATDSGATHGIAMNVLKAQMNFAAGTYFLDLLRTDGGRNEDLMQGAIVQLAFTAPITNTSLA